MSEMQYKNKQMIGWVTGLSVLMGILYIVNAFTSSDSTVLLLCIVALVFIPVIVGWVIYSRDNDSQLLHYVMLYGFEIFYCGLLLYTHSPMVTMYIIPILFLSMIYEDSNLCRIMGIISVIFNILDVIIEVAVKHNSEIDNYEIQIAGSILFLLFMLKAAKCIEHLSKRRLNDIGEAKEKTDHLLNEIMVSAKELTERVAEINAESKNMAESGAVSEKAIECTVSATRQLNANVQKQLEKSCEISELLDTTLQIANGVGIKVEETLAVTNTGNEAVKQLGDVADIGREAGMKADESMAELVERVKEAVAILDVISGITKKTSMLALNASIEAARAGEAGRGFAVVANEINDLSSETDSATGKINKILGELSDCTRIAGESVNKLLKSNKQQLELVYDTGAAFEKINAAIQTVSVKINEQGEYIGRVSNTNNDIKNQVETLSGFAQELLANTEDTQNTSERTIEGTRNISDYLDNVMKEVDKLNELMNI